MLRGDELWLAVCIHAIEHLEIRELGNVLGERVVGLPLAFLVQHHHRDAGDRLRHREDAHDRVFLQRLAALQIGNPARAVFNDLTVARGQSDDPRQLLFVDDLLHACREALPIVIRVSEFRRTDERRRLCDTTTTNDVGGARHRRKGDNKCESK